MAHLMTGSKDVLPLVHYLFSYEALMGATRNYFQKYGIPQSFYVDCRTVFKVNMNNPDGEKVTQWERAIKELGVKVIHAKSPQAKGRVERANKTLQDRLIKEMQLADIRSIEEANQFVLKQYIPAHNQKFSVLPTNEADVHRSLDQIDLDDILCLKHKRILANDYTISYKRQIFQLTQNQKTILRPKNPITVKQHLDGTIKLSIRQTPLEFISLDHRPIKQKNTVSNKKKPKHHYKPSANHPWRTTPLRTQPTRQDLTQPKRLSR